MEYIISEKELKALGVTEKFLKSQEPVELLVQGEVFVDDEDGEVWIDFEKWNLRELFMENKGQNIKIYIQKKI